MRNKATSTVYAGLFALAMAAPVAAKTINVNFNGNGNSIDYTFSTSFDGTQWSGSLDSATFNVGSSSTTYSTSAYTLQMGSIGEVSTFEVYSGSTLISQMVYNGMAYITNGSFGSAGGVFEMFYYGDQTTYSAANYGFSSSVDSSGNVNPMLYISGGPTPFGNLQMTGVSVSTVSAVPAPAAAWLFASGLIGLIGISRRRTR